MKKAILIFSVIIAFGVILLATDALGFTSGAAHRGVLQFHSEPALLVLFGAGLMLAGRLAGP